MKKKNTRLTPRDFEVLLALIDPKTLKSRGTQKDASKTLGYELYVISRSVKRLIEGKYIKKSQHGVRGTYYLSHTNYPIAISQITAEFEAAYNTKVQLIADRVAVTYSLPAEAIQEPFTLQPHFSGSMPYFNVVSEGLLDFTQNTRSHFFHVINRGPISPLKMTKREKALNGSENWDGLYTVDYGRSFKLRYLKTKKHRQFYIGPQYDIESLPAELLQNIDAPYDRVVLECYPILDWLTKYAGWKFTTDAAGNYIPLNKTPLSDVHIQVNHQPTTDFLKEHVGPFKADGLGADESGGTLRYEVKANRPDYVAALVDGPVTRALAFKHEKEVSDLNGNVGIINRSIDDLKDSFGREIYAVWTALEEVAQTQNATVKVTSNLVKASEMTSTDADGVMFG